MSFQHFYYNEIKQRQTKHVHINYFQTADVLRGVLVLNCLLTLSTKVLKYYSNSIVSLTFLDETKFKFDFSFL